MTWKQRYHLTSYLRSSLWVVPIAAGALAQIFGAVVFALDGTLGWGGLHFGIEGAKAINDTVITLTLSFVVFTFGSLLVAIQVASGQYTPRIIATTLLRDNVIRYTVGLFVFALIFAVKAKNHMDGAVPQLVTFCMGAIGFVCLASFLFMIDYAARLLRPVTLVARVGHEGLKVLESVYPELLATEKAAPSSPPVAGPVERTVAHRGTSAIVLAVDAPRLMAEAERVGGVIEFAPQVGDFVGIDEPLFHLHGRASAVSDGVLRGSVIFGSERTMEQDPLFAIRILVDIAIKALSAAINDPTTAVLAIDQLQRLLGRAGRYNLRTDFLHDAGGSLRVILRTPNWDDFVKLAFTEIRCCGATSVQIARRLRALTVNLGNTLPAKRQSALRQELNLLDRMLEKVWSLPEDLALARIADSQGLGGSTEMTPPQWAA